MSPANTKLQRRSHWFEGHERATRIAAARIENTSVVDWHWDREGHRLADTPEPYTVLRTVRFDVSRRIDDELRLPIPSNEKGCGVGAQALAPVDLPDLAAGPFVERE